VAGLVINEVEYDQVGADGDEFIEIYNGSPTAISLTNLRVLLVNGDGSVRETIDLSTAMPDDTLAAGAYLVIANSAYLAASVSADREVAYAGTIQNGMEGVALVDVSRPALIDALSYEGSLVADLSGIGLSATQSLVEGTATTAEDSNTIAGSLARLPNGTDTDDASVDWGFATSTPGAANLVVQLHFGESTLSSLEILITNSVPIAAFQFTTSGLTNLGYDVDDGVAGGLEITTAANFVSGFNGNVPAGTRAHLITLTFDEKLPGELDKGCFSGFVFTDTDNNTVDGSLIPDRGTEHCFSFACTPDDAETALVEDNCPTDEVCCEVDIEVSPDPYSHCMSVCE